jgi:hypothetical protein
MVVEKAARLTRGRLTRAGAKLGGCDTTISIINLIII